MSNAALREQLCRFGRSLFDRGYTHGASGNLSVRLDDGGWLVTPTNVSLGALDPATLSRLDDTGRLIDGPAPTKEVPLHQAMYRSRHDTGAVVHLHSTHSVAVSILADVDPADVFPPLTAYQLMRLGKVILLPFYAPGDPAVGNAIDALNGAYAAVLLANHGPVVAGKSLEEASYAIEELEQTAKIHLLTAGRALNLVTRSF